MKLVIAAIFAMLIISSAGLAADIYQYNVVAELGDNVQYKQTFILSNYTENRFTFSIPGSLYDFAIDSDVVCEQKDDTWGKTVECVIPYGGDRIDISVSYTAQNKIAGQKNYLIYSDSFKMPYRVERFSLLVKLPEGNGLIKSDDAYTPAGALLGSDGRRASIYWVGQELVEGYTFDSSVAYEPIGAFDYASMETMFIIIITIIILAVVFLKYFGRPKQEIKVILPVLKEDEKKIFESIIKHEPGVNQKVVVKDSGYSKAKVSKVLKNLQERGLLKLERMGRTNKVHYDKKFQKKD